jgi:hypothetical protein
MDLVEVQIPVMAEPTLPGNTGAIMEALGPKGKDGTIRSQY